MQDSNGQSHGSPYFVRWSVRNSQLVLWGRESLVQVSIPDDLVDPIAVAMDTYSVVALPAEGASRRWGVQPPSILPDLTNVYKVAKQQDSDTMLLYDGTIGRCRWIDQVPVGLNNLVDIGRARSYVLALRSDGRMFAWGNPDSPVLMEMPNLSDVVAIAAGDKHALAVRRDGTVTAWGTLYSGGDPTPPEDLDQVVAVSAGADHSLALRADGRLIYWGAYAGQPDLSAIDEVVAIASSGSHSLALRSDGSVLAWGSNNDGEINVPENLGYAVSIAAGNTASAAIIGDAPSNARLTNLSVRSHAGDGDQTLVVGFVIAGTGTKHMLMRGIGPGLESYNVASFLSDPKLELYRGDQSLVESNSRWVQSSDLVDLFNAVGAFPLTADSLGSLQRPRQSRQPGDLRYRSRRALRRRRTRSHESDQPISPHRSRHR